MSTPTETIRILIVDDHAVVREGLRSLISFQTGMDVVGEASDGAKAVRLARQLDPDVILLDLVMPNMDGLTAIGEIQRVAPQARVLVITSFAEDDKVFPAIKAGALGYLLKDSAPQELIQAIRQVYRGESSLHPTIARKLIREMHQPAADPQPSDHALTAREMEVLQLVAQGLTNHEISDELVISERTVRNYVSNILSKLHVANRVQAALYALREGLSQLDD